MADAGTPTDLQEHPACEVARAAIAERGPQLTQTLEAWANCNSGSDNRDGILQMSELVRDHAGFLPGSAITLVSPLDQQPCALQWQYSPHDDVPRVLLNGHLDTVFPADHPFQTCRLSEPDRIHGPGVADMKGGLVIMFAALQAFMDSEFSDRLAWEVLVTFDEEVGSSHNREHLESAARRHDLGIVFESSPEVDELIRNRMGTGKIEITCHGQAAHAGRNFGDGKNAILALTQYLARIHELNNRIPGSIVNIGAVSGGGPINVVPDHATAAANVRAVDLTAQTEVMQALHDIATTVSEETGCRLEITGGFTRPPKVADDATLRLLEAWKTVGLSMGLDIHWRDTGGASDGNTLQAAGLPVIDNLGAVGTHLHSDKEFAECGSLVTRAQLTATFLIQLASSRLDHLLTDPARSNRASNSSHS